MDALYGADDTVDVVPLVDDPFAMRETFEQLRERSPDFVDGTWRIGRGTICRDLQQSFATTCPP